MDTPRSARARQINNKIGNMVDIAMLSAVYMSLDFKTQANASLLTIAVKTLNMGV